MPLPGLGFPIGSTAGRPNLHWSLTFHHITLAVVGFRRSPVYGSRGMVASSQPLATEAGLRILQSGGNAADAAVAVAAALGVTEPCSTGKLTLSCHLLKQVTVHSTQYCSSSLSTYHADQVLDCSCSCLSGCPSLVRC